MSSSRGGTAAVCQLLRDDPDLAEAIPVSRRAQATQECVAQTVRMGPGRWQSDRIDIGHAGLHLEHVERLIPLARDGSVAAWTTFATSFARVARGPELGEQFGGR